MKDQEWEEFQAEVVDRFRELHKKSMVTVLIMLALTEHSMWAKELEKWCDDIAGWQISERGLHRTLKRMNGLGLIEYIENGAPRTGVKRKTYSLSEFGFSTLKAIKQSSLKYSFNERYNKRLQEI